MGGAAFAKAGADATNSAITTYAQGMQERAQMKATQAENERLNKMQWEAMGNRLNTVALQRGLLRQQTGTDLYNIGKEANRAMGASLNNAAAAGIEGASVNDAANDIKRQQQTAMAKTRANEQIQEINMDTQVDDIINSAVNAQRYSQKPTSRGEVIGRAWGTSTMQFFSSLVGSSFDYQPTSGNQWSQGGSGTSQTTAYDAKAATDPGTGNDWMNYDFNKNYDQSFNLDDGTNNRYQGYNSSNYSIFGS